MSKCDQLLLDSSQKILPSPDQVNGQPKKFKKKRITQRIRYAVWNTYIGEDQAKSNCRCCLTTTISMQEFECGPLYDESPDKINEVSNLRPICWSCKSSMKTTPISTFVSLYGLRRIKSDSQLNLTSLRTKLAVN